MKVVLDTNVVVSGIFFGGAPGRILGAWRQGRLMLAIWSEIIDEYFRVAEILAERYPGVDIEPLLSLLVQGGEVVRAPGLPQPVCDDPDDDKFVSCALESGADIIISGDKKLLVVSGYQGVTVMTPRRFVDSHL